MFYRLLKGIMMVLQFSPEWKNDGEPQQKLHFVSHLFKNK